MRNPDIFNLFIPASFEIEKGGQEGEIKSMRIKGIASTPDKDAQEEILEPGGFILDRLLTQGFINYNHQAKNDPSFIIGEPEVAKIIPNKGLYLEGKLYNNSSLARSVYELGKVLEEENSDRRLGFSIEGKALERDPSNPKRITKALITGVAVTPTPVNANTIVEICKGNYEDAFVEEYKYGENGGDEYIIDVTRKNGTRVRVDKELKIVIDKASAQETGKVLSKESLEGKLKKLDFSKSEVQNAVLNLSKKIVSELEKGGKAQLGEIREWQGGRYEKTASGWKRVEDNTGKKDVKQTLFKQIDKMPLEKLTKLSMEGKLEELPGNVKEYIKDKLNGTGKFKDSKKRLEGEKR